MKTRNHAHCCTALLLALLLLLTSCGSAEAATMHLTHTVGNVVVSDAAGKNITPKENLGLYSGYEMKSHSASYAWINLDDVKLVKMDENSGIVIQKEGKNLEIEIKSGSLFFNVSQPLKAEETMHIRTASMLAGIRGTCGWVEVPDAGHMNVYLLEGRIACTAGETVAVTAGQVGRLDEAAGTVTIEPFAQDAIPGFVRTELDGIPLDGIPSTIEAPEPESSPAPDPDADVQDPAITEQTDTDDGGADRPAGTNPSRPAQTQTGSGTSKPAPEQNTTYWDKYSSTTSPSLTPKPQEQTSPSDADIRPSTPVAEPDASAGEPAGSNAPADEPSGSDAPASEPASSDAPAGEPSGSDAPASEPTGSDVPAGEPSSSEAPAGEPVGSDTPASELTGPSGTESDIQQQP